MGQGGDTYQTSQKAIAKGKNSLAITAAAYSNVTVYQYVTYEGDSATARAATDPSVCPYPGLETFHTSEANYFAGRDEDIALLEAKLVDHDICGVIAASGAGKSSLVHAGLIPALAKRENEVWDVFAFKPGQEPLYGLARSMSGVLVQGENRDAQLNEIRRNVENLRETTGRLSEYVEEIIRRRSGTTSGKRHHVLIFIDQWEELYTQENDEERDILVRELMEVAERGLAKVLLTMRIDFMEEMLLLSTDFFRDLKPGIHFVEPMDETGLRSVIEVPAGEVGLGVPEALTSRLIADLGKGRDHGSLPYLQFVLRQLWEVRDRVTNSLTTEAYDGFKGLKGAIGAHADAVFRNLTTEEQGTAQRVLPRLANVTEAGAITSRRLPFADFDAPARKLLRKLAEPKRRLIVLSSATEEVAEAEIVAEVAHEALLDDWKTLSGWVADRKDFFRLRNKLEADAKTWIENNRRNDFLIPAGKPLLDAQDLSAKALEGDISKNLKDFIEASDSHARSRKWLTRGLLTAVVSGIAGIAIYLANLNDELRSSNSRLAEQTQAAEDATSAEREARRLAEQRAAILSLDGVLGQIEEGKLHAALNTLISVGRQFAEYEIPDKVLITFGRALDRAAKETRYDIPQSAIFFELKESVYYIVPEEGALFEAVKNGPPRLVINLHPNSSIKIFEASQNYYEASQANQLFAIVSRDGKFEFFSVDNRLGNWLPIHIESLFSDDDYRIEVALDGRVLMTPARFEQDEASVGVVHSASYLVDLFKGQIVELDDYRGPPWLIANENGASSMPSEYWDKYEVEMKKIGIKRIDGDLSPWYRDSCAEEITKHELLVEDYELIDEVKKNADGFTRVFCDVEGRFVLFEELTQISSGSEFAYKLYSFESDRSLNDSDPNALPEPIFAYGTGVGTGQSSLFANDASFGVAAVDYSTLAYRSEVETDEGEKQYSGEIKFAGEIEFLSLLDATSAIVVVNDSLRGDEKKEMIIVDFSKDRSLVEIDWDFFSPLPSELKANNNLALKSVCTESNYLEPISPHDTIILQAFRDRDDHWFASLEWNGRQIDFVVPKKVDDTIENGIPEICLALNDTGEYFAIFDGSDILVFNASGDLEYSVDNPKDNFASFQFAPGSELEIFVAMDNELTIHRREDGDNWISSLVLESKYPIISFTTDLSGKRLIFIEHRGRGQMVASVYSADAGMIWRDIAQGYKAVGVSVLDDNSILSKGHLFGAKIFTIRSLGEEISLSKEYLEGGGEN